MKKDRNARDLGDAEMDMTPMIDVTFLLLIFFLCMEFKTLEGKLGANLPDLGPNTSAAKPEETLDLRIVCTNWGQQVPEDAARPKGRFELAGHESQWYVGAKRVQDRARLAQELSKAALVQVVDAQGRREARRVVIKTGQGVTYGDVTEVIDLAREAGFERISFGGAGGLRKR